MGCRGGSQTRPYLNFQGAGARVARHEWGDKPPRINFAAPYKAGVRGGSQSPPYLNFQGVGVRVARHEWGDNPPQINFVAPYAMGCRGGSQTRPYLNFQGAGVGLLMRSMRSIAHHDLPLRDVMTSPGFTPSLWHRERVGLWVLSTPALPATPCRCAPSRPHRAFRGGGAGRYRPVPASGPPRRCWRAARRRGCSSTACAAG